MSHSGLYILNMVTSYIRYIDGEEDGDENRVGDGEDEDKKGT